MRILILVFWLLIPVGAFAYHLGPGKDHMRSDGASGLLAIAELLVADEQWPEAEEAYKEAISLLPDDAVGTQRRARLELAKVQMNNRGLPQANDDLKVLVDELIEDENADPEMLADARMALANSQFYITWLMRLEGRAEEDWGPEITSSQQIYRLLAEQAEEEGDSELTLIRKSDLESSVKLARMDLGELSGLPLPSQ